MLSSMTGFGKAECELTDKKLLIEIKSLNSKQLDISTRLPSFIKDKEIDIRNEISRELDTGLALESALGALAVSSKEAKTLLSVFLSKGKGKP